MTHRQPTHRDIGKQCEFQPTWSGRWVSGELRGIVYWDNEASYRIYHNGAMHEERVARIPLDLTDPAAQLAVAADALSDAGMDLAAEVLKGNPDFALAPLEWSRTDHADGDVYVSASTPFGSYNVNQVEGACNWSYCFDEYYDEANAPCDSLEDGCKLAWEHWKTRCASIIKRVATNETPNHQ